MLETLLNLNLRGEGNGFSHVLTQSVSTQGLLDYLKGTLFMIHKNRDTRPTVETWEDPLQTLAVRAIVVPRDDGGCYGEVVEGDWGTLVGQVNSINEVYFPFYDAEEWMGWIVLRRHRTVDKWRIQGIEWNPDYESEWGE